MSERPYLILTLRRTGGTSLMSFLARASSFPVVQHEPLNPGRVWGEITTGFRDTGDEAALRAALEARLEQRGNIKHCFEIIPYPVTLALIEACAARDYAIALLIRREEASRLRSLALAKATDAWGPKQAAAIYPRILSGAQRLAPVDLEELRQRANKDTAALEVILRHLRQRDIAHDWLVFEDIYARDGRIGERARAIAARFGIAVAPGDPHLDAFAGTTGQGTAEILPHLPNAGALEALLDELRARPDPRPAEALGRGQGRRQGQRQGRGQAGAPPAPPRRPGARG